MTPKCSLQELFFQAIIDKQGKQATETIMSLLHLEKSAVYNRMKGVTPLPFEDFLKLCQAFHIDPSSFLPNQQKNVKFHFGPLRKPVLTCADFLAPVLQAMRALNTTKSCEIWYATSEIPIFHYFHFRELTLFKLFTWSRSTWDLPALRTCVFNPDSFSEADVYESYAKPILSAYSQIDSFEFWNPNIYDNTLNQIQYYYAIGELSNTIKALLTEQLQILLSNQEQQGISGLKRLPNSKQTGGHFKLYNNEIIQAGNTFLLEHPTHPSVWSVYNNPNAMQSTEPDLIEYTQKWFLNLQQKSVLISATNEKERRAFFNSLKAKISSRL